MEIALHVSSNTNHAPKRVEKPIKKISKNRGADDGFSFNFVKNSKIKAVVARKRAKPAVSALENKEKSNSFQEMKKAPEAEVASENYVPRPPNSSGDEDDTSPKKDENIFLNLIKDDSVVPKQEKKKKLTRQERQQLKGEKRQNRDKVFTAEEISEGLKKFSQPTKTKVERKAPVNSDMFKNLGESKIMGQRLIKPVEEKLFTGAPVSSLDLHPHCVKNLEDNLKITELTQVQQKTIPRALEGKDLLIRSQTGSGKTLAYALPIVQKLQEIRPKLTRDCGIQAVVVVPTREIGIQAYEVFVTLLKPFTWIVPGLLSGGEKRKAEKARLRKGINVLVGSPGRLVDHLLHTETFRLDKVKWLIVDEADRLLEMGFERDVRKIMEGINNHKAGRFKLNEDSEAQAVSVNATGVQRMLLSATLTPAVQKLAGLTLANPLFIETADLNEVIPNKNNDEEALDEGNLVVPSTIELNYVLVPPKLRLVTLAGLLAKECAKKKLKALVFIATMEMVNYHHDLLNETLTQRVLDDEDEPDDSGDEDEPLLKGMRFYKLHGSMTQTERCGVFKSFIHAKSGILLATDVAGRGIDVPEVDLVIQYTPPLVIADFVHRVGRTARAGKSGRAILLLGPNDTDLIKKLEEKRIRITQIMMEPLLEPLKSADSEAHTSQEAAANLQYRIEELLRGDREMHNKACTAFVSWVKFYSTFRKDMKQIFNLSTAHLGHYAKSFGLREPPKSFARQHNVPKPPLPTNRLTYTERDPQKIKQQKAEMKRAHSGKEAPNKLHKYLPKSISLTISEFDSGMPEKKKKKK